MLIVRILRIASSASTIELRLEARAKTQVQVGGMCAGPSFFHFFRVTISGCSFKFQKRWQLFTMSLGTAVLFTK